MKQLELPFKRRFKFKVGDLVKVREECLEPLDDDYAGYVPEDFDWLGMVFEIDLIKEKWTSTNSDYYYNREWRIDFYENEIELAEVEEG